MEIAAVMQGEIGAEDACRCLKDTLRYDTTRHDTTRHRLKYDQAYYMAYKATPVVRA